MSPSLAMFDELLDDTFQYEHEKSTPWDNLGHFFKSEVGVRLMNTQDTPFSFRNSLCPVW